VASGGRHGSGRRARGGALGCSRPSPLPRPEAHHAGGTFRKLERRTTMRILSGIQPTGAKHLGNYSGGFRQYVATQEQGEAYFCLVELHSLTWEYDPADLPGGSPARGALLLASALAPQRSTPPLHRPCTAHA